MNLYDAQLVFYIDIHLGASGIKVSDEKEVDELFKNSAIKRFSIEHRFKINLSPLLRDGADHK